MGVLPRCVNYWETWHVKCPTIVVWQCWCFLPRFKQGWKHHCRSLALLMFISSSNNGMPLLQQLACACVVAMFVLWQSCTLAACAHGIYKL